MFAGRLPDLGSTPGIVGESCAITKTCFVCFRYIYILEFFFLFWMERGFEVKRGVK